MQNKEKNLLFTREKYRYRNILKLRLKIDC